MGGTVCGRYCMWPQLTSECKVVYCLALGKKSGANVQHCTPRQPSALKPAQFSNFRILLIDHCALCHSNTMPCSINTMECQLHIADSRCLTSHRAILPPWLNYISCLATEWSRTLHKCHLFSPTCSNNYLIWGGHPNWTYAFNLWQPNHWH